MSKKQTIFLTIIFIMCFCILSISTGLALFTLDVSFETQRDKATAATMPTIVFNAGDAIQMEANSFNFVEPGQNLISETTSTAELYAGSDPEVAQEYYDLKVNIEINDFTYTTSSNEAELLLIITDPDGQIVRNVDDLTFVSAGGYDGFDITGKTGVYEVAKNRLIETSSYTIDSWKFQVVFVNYEHSQDTNRGRTLMGNIIIGKTGEI